MIAQSDVTQEHAKPKLEYPVLMIGRETGTIVLWSKWGVGTVMHIGNSCTVTLGYYSENWVEENFETFNGHVDLSNS